MNKVDGWLIYSPTLIKKHKKFIDLLLLSAKKYKINIKVMDSTEFFIAAGSKNQLYYKNKLVKELPNFVFLRTIAFSLGRFLQLNGVKVINNVESMILSKDKLRVHTILTNNNIRTPETLKAFKVLKYEELKKIFNNSVFIAKDNYGFGGEGVYLISNEQDYLKLENKKRCIYQEYIETTKGKDLRVYVLGDKVIGCVQRNASNEEEFRANLNVGGYATEYKLTEKIESLCLKIAKNFNLDFVGIDLLFDKDGFSVCEINSLAAFKSLKATKNVIFSDEFCKYIIKNDKFENWK